MYKSGQQLMVAMPLEGRIREEFIEKLVGSVGFVAFRYHPGWMRRLRQRQ